LPSFSHGLDKLIIGIKNNKNNKVVCTMHNGRSGIKQFLETIYQYLNIIFGLKVNKRYKNYPIDYSINMNLFKVKFLKFYNSSVCDSVLNESVNFMKKEKEKGYYSRINIYDEMHKKITSDLFDYIRFLDQQAFGLLKGLEHLKPDIIISNHTLGLNNYIGYISSILNIPSLLIPHGSVYKSDNKWVKYDQNVLAFNQMVGHYKFVLIQSPPAKSIAEELGLKNEKLIVTGPVLWLKISKNRLKEFDNILNITYANTYKRRNNRRYIYETSDEFLSSLIDVCDVVKNHNNLRLTIQFRADSEISLSTLKSFIPQSDNIIISQDSLNMVLEATDLLISQGSTIIEESLINRIPVLLYSNNSRFKFYSEKLYRNGTAPSSVNRINNINDLKRFIKYLSENIQLYEDEKYNFSDYIFSQNKKVEFNDWFKSMKFLD
jgi:hypothetical protein